MRPLEELDEVFARRARRGIDSDSGLESLLAEIELEPDRQEERTEALRLLESLPSRRLDTRDDQLKEIGSLSISLQEMSSEFWGADVGGVDEHLPGLHDRNLADRASVEVGAAKRAILASYLGKFWMVLTVEAIVGIGSGWLLASQVTDEVVAAAVVAALGLSISTLFALITYRAVLSDVARLPRYRLVGHSKLELVSFETDEANEVKDGTQ